MLMTSLAFLSVVTSRNAATSIEPFLTFSAGFTDDAVLQRGPGAAAVYGLAPRGMQVTVTLTDEHGISAPVALPASIVAMGGTADPLCQARCVATGRCAEGQISACQKPSCAMGCILAGRTPSATVCKADCAVAASDKSGCEFTVVSPAGPWHLPQDTTQNQTLQMCSNGPILSNGTQCSSCSGPECEPGCDFGAPAGRALLDAWKVLLPPQPAGGSFTITASAGSESVSVRRVTFGDVYFCSGQSNMDLALMYTFEKPALDEAVQRGRYSNIRLFQYGDMGTKYEELVPTFATTTGTLHDTGPSGGTWSTLSAASVAIPNPSAGASYNLFGQFSATCFYFGAALVDERAALVEEAEEGAAVPIGLIQSAIGGSQIEAWTPDSALGQCANESLNADGQAPPGTRTVTRSNLRHRYR
jgi:hypothetical protein